MFGVVGYEDAPGRPFHDRSKLPRHQDVNGFATSADYPGVLTVERDPEAPHPPTPRDTAITQIKAEQIAVCRRR
jgi:hypothetical protein